MHPYFTLKNTINNAINEAIYGKIIDILVSVDNSVRDYSLNSAWNPVLKATIINIGNSGKNSVDAEIYDYKFDQ